MMELGEGLCKLRKMRFESGSPLFSFEKEVSAVLEFVYQTQMELAACMYLQILDFYYGFFIFQWKYIRNFLDAMVFAILYAS